MSGKKIRLLTKDFHIHDALNEYIQRTLPNLDHEKITIGAIYRYRLQCQETNTLVEN